MGLLTGKQPLSADELSAQVASELALASQLSEPVIEAAAGYRAKCADAGFAPDAAEQMSVDYHAGLLRLMLR